MEKTERLFDKNSYGDEFGATVLECVKNKDGKFEIALDRTYFFPEEGGQTSDTGTLENINVSHVYEKEGIIYHVCDGELCPGKTVRGKIRFESRYRKMQNHTGEHIVSGLVNKKYGYDNVGFHLSEHDMTIDFSGELDRESLDEIETLANRVVYSCIPVKAFYPEKSELKTLEYRSKIDLEDMVRIVEIGEVDRCACCAPHVGNTGEIGIIKLLDFMRYKGGVRIHARCGMDALEDYRNKYREIYTVSNLLSSKQGEISRAVNRLLDSLGAQKSEILSLKRELMRLKSQSIGLTEGNICLFETEKDMNVIRELVNNLVKKCGGMCAVFSENGNDGYQYIIASENVDMKQKSAEINLRLNGKGGGSKEMIRGSCKCAKEDILRYFDAENEIIR